MHPIAVNTLSPWAPGLLSMALFTLMVLGLVGMLVLAAGWIGERKQNPNKLIPYECGVIPTGEARFPFPVPFYLVATFFLIFDVEAVYIFAWAVVLDDLGWVGWLQVSFFIGVLLVSLFYVWQKGGLDWETAEMKGLGRRRI